MYLFIEHCNMLFALMYDIKLIKISYEEKIIYFNKEVKPFLLRKFIASALADIQNNNLEHRYMS